MKKKRQLKSTFFFLLIRDIPICFPFKNFPEANAFLAPKRRSGKSFKHREKEAYGLRLGPDSSDLVNWSWEEKLYNNHGSHSLSVYTYVPHAAYVPYI